MIRADNKQLTTDKNLLLKRKRECAKISANAHGHTERDSFFSFRQKIDVEDNVQSQ